MPLATRTERQFDQLERRHSWMWGFTVVVMIALAAAVVFLYVVSFLGDTAGSLPAPESHEMLAIGLGGLVLLFSLYMLHKHQEVRRVRALLIQARLDEERTELELRAALETGRIKTEFLATMSHEIRTPLTGIIGMVELALGAEPPPELKEYLANTQTCAEDLLTLLNDVLDFSKIDAGKLDLEAIPFSLRDCIGSGLKVLAVRGHQKGLSVACHIPMDVPDAVLGDPGRLRQIILNLVGNGIKFTESGEVVLSVHAESESDRETVLRFSVRDTGIGIPADKQGLIFEPFRQADGSTTRKYGGTGLGLAISAHLANLMGGHLSLESEPGKGSTFSFTAHFGLQVGAHLKPPRTPVELKDKWVLIVDDNSFNRWVYTEMIESWEMRPLAVEDGEAALAALAAARRDGAPFDLALLDLRMPGMDGLTLADRIKSDPGLVGSPGTELEFAL